MGFSLETLEFQRLLELASRHAQTPMGVERMADLRPFESRRALNDALAAIREAVFLNEERQVSWSFRGLQDPKDALSILRIQNASLEPN
jgi:dsDNA-specific endonuclease/ATPase MutS2